MERILERILVVDDDTEFSELVIEYLAPEGFAVEARHDGESGLQAARNGSYDLIILDVMIPRLSGLDVLRRLRSDKTSDKNVDHEASRSNSRVPILMLTARGEDIDRIVGLELGADDYLPKPFNPRELTARIRAILRRASSGESSTRESETLVVGDLQVFADARRVQKNDETVELTGVEFDILWKLLQARGETVSRKSLTQDVLGRRALPLDRSIDTHISNLRRKLGAHQNGGERIKSIRSVGYIYVAN